MSNILVISPTIAKESARELALALGADYINIGQSKIRDLTPWDLVVNYGFSRKITTNKVINQSENIKISRDKIECLTRLKGKCPTIVMTKEKEEAKKWIEAGRIAVARAIVKGDNGKGLAYCTTIEELENTEAIFWTRYIEHTNEYRVNVYKGNIVSVYDKVRQKDFFKFNLIKGQDNNVQLKEMVKTIYENVGLDWFGMDVLRTAKGSLYFLEVNSAPVLFPYTITKFVKLIKAEIE